MRNIKHFRHIAARAASMAAAAVMALIMVAAFPADAHADSSTFDGNCSFDGKEITADFTTQDIAKMFENLQPGDDMTFNVRYTNDYDHDTDWYMKNIVVQTLEKADAARKQVSGTGTPESGGYTYTITHTDKDGNTELLFSNDKIGGSDEDTGEEVTAGGREGLEQATNALEEYFAIETLGYQESGSVSVYVKFEGETEVNDYMDTDGEIDVRFAVELSADNDNPGTSKRVYTGDNSRLLMWAAAFVASSVILAIAALIMSRREKDTDSRETGGAE